SRPDAHASEDLPDRDPLPPVVKPAPPRHAVNVRRDFGPRKLEELLPRPRDLLVDEAEAPKSPSLQVGVRCRPVREDGPLLRGELPGRQQTFRLRLSSQLLHPR